MKATRNVTPGCMRRGEKGMQNMICRTATILIGAIALSLYADGELVIQSMDENGFITWSNTTPDKVYQLEWTTRPEFPLDWRRGYGVLTDISALVGEVKVPAPRYFRVVASDNLLVPNATNVRAGVCIEGVEGVFWKGERFRILTDTNIILDNLTGLMWIRDAALISRTNWFAAQSQIESLTIGGYDDWRYPTLDEMQTLFNREGQVIGQQDLVGSPSPFRNYVPLYYWCSNVCASTPPTTNGRIMIKYGVTPSIAGNVCSGWDANNNSIPVRSPSF